jgi:hypothetical protein
VTPPPPHPTPAADSADSERTRSTEDFVAGVTHDMRGDLATAVPTTPDVHALYWSVRGEVACATHAPGPEHQRWSDERWAPIPPEVDGRHGMRFQCEHCADSKTPIIHRRLNTYSHL